MQIFDFNGKLSYQLLQFVKYILMEGEFDYSEQKIIKDEQLFRIDQESLLQNLTHRSIGAITFLNNKKKSAYGSGVMISKDLFLTVAHNLYNRKQQSQYNGFKIYFPANGTGKEFHEVEAMIYEQNFRNLAATGSERLKSDYGLIKLKRPVQFDKFLKLALPCEICLMKDNNETFLQIFGFPGDYDKNYKRLDKYGEVIVLFQYGLAMNNRIIAIEPEKFKISYAISTVAGQSGCPVVHNETIISLHNGGVMSDDYNIGRLITAEMLANVLIWAKELKGDSFEINESNICEHIAKRLKQAKLLKEKVPNPPSLSKQEIQRMNNLLQSKNPNRIPQKVKDYLLKNVGKKEISVPKSQLYAIDLTNNIKMTGLFLYDNNLRHIDLHANINLIQVALQRNSLLQIDLSNNINLQKIDLNRNSLRHVDFSKNVNLTEINLNDNRLESICLTNCVNLTSLRVVDNKLKQIDVRSCINLAQVVLFINPLKSIDLSNNPKVKKLQLSATSLSKLTFFYSSKFTLNDGLNFSKLDTQSCYVTMLYREGELQGCKNLWQQINESYNEGKNSTQQDFKKYINPKNCKYIFNPKLIQ